MFRFPLFNIKHFYWPKGLIFVPCCHIEYKYLNSFLTLCKRPYSSLPSDIILWFGQCKISSTFYMLSVYILTTMWGAVGGKTGENRGASSQSPSASVQSTWQSSNFQMGFPPGPTVPTTSAGVGGTLGCFASLFSPEAVLKKQPGLRTFLLSKVRSVPKAYDLLLYLKL